GVCTALMPNGRNCTAGTQCTTGFCADGVCCSTACTDQCASCSDPTSLGVCHIVTGAPHTNSTPSRADCAGTAPCKGSCNGSMKTCQFAGASTTCGNAASCTMGTMTPAGACNGAGTCTPGTPAPCMTAYCAGSTCGAC